MTRTADLVVRSFHAERVRTAGCSRLRVVFVPAAIAVPLGISVFIAVVAERFARIPGQVGILQVATSNAGYWVVSITVMVVAAAAADGVAAEYRYRTGEYMTLAIPARWAGLLGRWLFYGSLGAVLSAVTALLVLMALPAVSELVYGPVSVLDGHGRRLLWTIAVYAFFAAGSGVGIGAALKAPTAAIGVVFFWAYAVEGAVAYLPSAASLQRFMPLINAIYATGQETALDPPWGKNVALAYVGALCVAAFGAAVFGSAAVETLERRKGK